MVSIFAGEAEICPEPTRGFLIFYGGHVVKMVKRDGQWSLGRVYID